MSDTLIKVSPSTIETSDAYLAFRTVMERLLITPNYLYLEHEVTDPEFTLTFPGMEQIGIKAAISLVHDLKNAFCDLGRNPHTSDLLISPDGNRVVCVVDEVVTLERPLSLPGGLSLVAVGQLYPLRAAHCVTTRRGLITNWTVSFNCAPAHLQELLEAP
jgi:hypothetical protein